MFLSTSLLSLWGQQRCFSPPLLKELLCDCFKILIVQYHWWGNKTLQIWFDWQTRSIICRAWKKSHLCYQGSTMRKIPLVGPRMRALGLRDWIFSVTELQRWTPLLKEIKPSQTTPMCKFKSKGYIFNKACPQPWQTLKCNTASRKGMYWEGWKWTKGNNIRKERPGNMQHLLYDAKNLEQ